MPSIFIVGVIIFMGFIFGEAAAKFNFPKVTGYILAGVVLNPQIIPLMPERMLDHTGIITNLALSIITFSVGGSLFYPTIKKLGKSIIYITIFEAEFAFILVAAGFLAILPFFMHSSTYSWVTVFIPASLLIACLASPTDPSATLAVAHEYKAKGEVTSTIMGVAAMDDVTGIVNYSIATVIAASLITHKAFSIYNSFVVPLYVIFGAVVLGIIFGLLFNAISEFVKRETEGVMIVLLVALLAICFGSATLIRVDELLSTMTMGIIVVNLNEQREKIFDVLQRYTEEMVFVIFFTVSGMHLNIGVLAKSFILILFFVVLRAMGKFIGTGLGAFLSNASSKVKKYTAGGLIPQGGIVVGLALMIKQDPDFSAISDLIVSLTIGATVLHEFIGPIFSRMALKKAGEINPRL